MAEVMELPGAMAYRSSPDEAMAHAKAIALHTLADRLEHGGPKHRSVMYDS
jgi:predicted RNase H-like HicB family nuclease